MTTDRKPLMAYVDPDLKRKIEQWAEDEQRSVSSLIAYVLTQAVNNRNSRNPVRGQ
jgi:hypothetical protein